MTQALENALAMFNDRNRGGLKLIDKELRDVSGATAAVFDVPDGATFLRFLGQFVVPASAQALMRVSNPSKSAYYAGATDYTGQWWTGNSTGTAPNAYLGVPEAGGASIALTGTATSTGFPMQFEGSINVRRTKASVTLFRCHAKSVAVDSVTRVRMHHFTYWLSGDAEIGLGDLIPRLQFFTTTNVVLKPSSFILAEWF